MTPRHQIFADAILRGASKTDAALEAGYKETRARQTGYRLATIGHIADYIAEKQQEAAVSAGMDAQWVLRELQATYEHARREKQLGAAIRALELAGRRWKLFTETVDHQWIESEAERLAREFDLDADEIVAEVQRMMKSNGT